ncbi:MAG: inositol monophosphatase family protein [Desulfotomaculaceae bacterium]|nr:inositol monophosphatase family protein [Desulfotomaculaceae bacterium]
MENTVYLETAVTLAQQAGDIIRSRFGGDFERGFKSGPSDLVTEVDRQAEDLITTGLRAKFPAHTVIGEENDSTAGGQEPGDDYTWYVDPLDGTTNFVYGIPFCCVSIGLSYHGRLTVGVVYDPLRRELFTAELGRGTCLNGRPVRVDETRKYLSDALLVTGYPSDKNYGGRLSGLNYQKIIASCNNLRALGSAALELAYISCGRLTGIWENTLMSWDVAAGSLLVAEAGGRVTDLAGNPLELRRYLSIAASNGFIHNELLQSLS